MNKIYLILFCSLFSVCALGQSKKDLAKSHTDSSKCCVGPNDTCMCVNKKGPRQGIGQILNVETFENNFVGYTKDNDDEPFLDFTLSVAFSLANFHWFPFLKKPQDFTFYMAFTGRFGQYLWGRESSPVVGKRFNPEFFVQYVPRGDAWQHSKFRLIYGHESNGQWIGSAATFYEAAKNNEGINETKDYISRGWDFVGISNTSVFFKDIKKPNDYILETEVNTRYYLGWGIFQKGKEEYRSWEQPWYGNNYTRNDVSGLAASVTLYLSEKNKLFGNKYFGINKVKLSGETGITRLFEAMSYKAQLGIKLITMPFAITYSNGYNGDIAQYGIKNSGWSIAYVLTSFNKPLF